MELLDQVESYLARTKVPPSTFGRMVVGDPRFVRDLRSGRRPRRKTQDRVQAYLASISKDRPARALATLQLSAADDPKPHSPGFQQIGFDAGNEVQALFRDRAAG